MPRNSTTGVFTRTANSFSNPVFGTIIDPEDADLLFDDYDQGLTASIAKEPTQATVSSVTVAANDGSIAIVRTAPAATTINLPTVASRNGAPLPISDWSTSVTEHTITIDPAGVETIQGLATIQIISTASQLASITLYPSTDLNGWFVA